MSSFGIGGTNAHLVLEEGPQLAAAPAARPWQLLTVSAKTSEALAARCRDLAGWLRGRSDTELADAAYTTQVGRAQFSYRYAAACGSAEEAGAILENAAKPENSSPAEPPAVVFLFPGQGTQHPRMGFDLYRHEPVFRTMVDHCAGLLRPAPGEDLRSVLFPAADADLEQAARKLTETAFAQPALFVLEYALASLWMSWGIEPRAMLGHSVGELVAACVAGVFSLPDALTLVAERGRLMQQMPHGAMLAAAVSEPEAWALCGGALSVAAVNAERLCVISGPEPDVDALRKILEERKTPCHVLHTSHAFHSRMMEPAAAMFRQVVEKVRCHAPRIPIASNVTGQWMTPEQAVDPGYWAEHILRPVRFGDGLARALTLGNPYFIEAGPGQALSKIARRNAGPGRPVKVVASLPDPGVDKSAGLTLTSALGQAWSEGVAVDWQAYHRDEKRRRVSLPTYPFQRERFWAFPDKGQGAALKRAGGQKRLELDNWFHVPGWKSAAQVDLLGVRQIPTGGAWLIVSSEDGPGHQAAERLRQSGEKVVEVRAQARFAGAGFECVAPGQRYSLDTTSAAGWRQLLSALKALDAWPHTIAHVLLAGELATGQEDRAFEEAQECGFESLLAMTQALEESTAATPSQLFVFTTGLAQVTGGERIRAEHATVLGLCRTIPQECPNIECRVVDLDSNGPVSELAASVVEEMRLSDPAALVAWRAGRRWRETYEPVTLKEPDRSPFRERGVYLITGGLGGLGLGLAKQLARECRARLVLAGRRELPPRADWDAYLRSQAENDSVAARLRALLEIEESGGEVLAIAADITDRGQLENAIAAAAGRFGAIDGVFHLAGVPGAGLLQMKSHREAAAVMAPKALGALALKQAFASRPLDFVVFFSSITAIVGGVGQSDYAAANTLLDALANSGGAFGKTPVIAIDWDAWQSDTWQDASLRAMPDLHRMLKENRKQFGIRFEEGFTVLRRAVAARVPQLIVSTKDLAETMSAHRKWARSLMEKANQSPGRAAGREKPRVRDASAAPPRNATEAAVAELWKEMLGLESIGIHDNFIELGGHSLLAIQLLARMREDLQVELPMRAIFERPTVAGIAELIAGQRDQSAPDENDIARILEEIEQLSEQEVNDKLQEAGGWPAVQTGPDSLAGNGQGRISCRT